MLMIMRHQQQVAKDVTLAAVVGVWPNAVGDGESDPEATRAGAEAMRRERIGPFARPEAILLGQPAPSGYAPIKFKSLSIRTPKNDIGDRGRRITVTGIVQNCASSQTMLIGRAGVVVGLLQSVGHDSWKGAALGEPNERELAVLAKICG